MLPVTIKKLHFKIQEKACTAKSLDMPGNQSRLVHQSLMRENLMSVGEVHHGEEEQH